MADSRTAGRRTDVIIQLAFRYSSLFWRARGRNSGAFCFNENITKWKASVRSNLFNHSKLLEEFYKGKGDLEVSNFIIKSEFRSFLHVNSDIRVYTMHLR